MPERRKGSGLGCVPAHPLSFLGFQSGIWKIVFSKIAATRPPTRHALPIVRVWGVLHWSLSGPVTIAEARLCDFPEQVLRGGIAFVQSFWDIHSWNLGHHDVGKPKTPTLRGTKTGCLQLG